jgi:hypothetical protein
METIMEKSFDVWFDDLVKEAEESGVGDIINKNDWGSYQEYYDDNDSPQEVLDTELSYADDDDGDDYEEE